MKVLFLAPQPFFRVRGTPINVRHMVTALAEAGHEVDLLCYPWGEDVQIDGVRIVRTGRWPGMKEVRVGPSPAKIPLDVLMFCKALAMCLRRSYDVIHAVEESAFFAVWLKKMFRCRMIYDMDSCISDQLRYTGFFRARPLLRFAESLERMAMRNSEFVLTVCQALSDEVRVRCPSVRIVQIEDAPLESAFHEDADGARRLRRELGLGEMPVVLYTGNFESYQGIDLLLQAFARVSRQRNGIACVLVGGEPDQVEQKKKTAASLNLGASCVFTGKRPMAEMPTFLSLASVLVSPRTDGTNTALKVYTYMQSGKPIVATRLATHTQVLDDECAILVGPGPDELAEGILLALGSPESAGALGRVARDRLEQQYSLERFNRQVREAYQLLSVPGDVQAEKRPL